MSSAAVCSFRNWIRFKDLECLILQYETTRVPATFHTIGLLISHKVYLTKYQTEDDTWSENYTHEV